MLALVIKGKKFPNGYFLGIYYWQTIGQIICKNSQQKADFYDQFLYKSKSCSSSTSTKFLTIGVISSYERLYTHLSAILKTWAKINDSSVEIIFFIEENPQLPVLYDINDYYTKLFLTVNEHNSCVYVVRLRHVINQYPPQLKGFYLIKYLYLFYGHRTSWILRLDDNAYVNLPKLIKWLKSLDKRKLLYIGQGGTGRQNENIHFKNGQYFCMGGSGVILSQMTLNKLGPKLDSCLRTVLTNHEDVEIGRCIIEHVHIRCTNAFDSNTYFYHHYGPNYSFGHDFTPDKVQKSFIIHPIKNVSTFYHIEVYKQRCKREQNKKRLNSLIKQKKNTIKSFKSKSFYRPFTTFIQRVNFDLSKDIQLQNFDVRWKSYVESIVEKYVNDLKYRWNRKTNWTLINGKYIFGYYRSLPTNNVELIIEIILNTTFQYSTHPRLAIVRKRIYVSKAVFDDRLEYREIMKTDQINNDKLNLIVVSSNKDDALRRFIKNFQQEILNSTSSHQILTLTCIYFHLSETTTSILPDDNNSPLKLINELANQYPTIVQKPIIYNVRFNRGYGRQLGASHFSPNDLLLFVDVDLMFTYDALISIRRFMLHQIKYKPNELAKCTVYFPVVYSHFSHNSNNSQCSFSNMCSKHNITSKHGAFSIYGFGMVATQRKDLDSIGGWETDNVDWGGEDVNLFGRFTKAGCTVYRIAEPGLRHYSEREYCKYTLGHALVEQCEEIEQEIESLLDIWRDYRTETVYGSTAGVGQNMMPDPPVVRSRLKKEIEFFVKHIHEQCANDDKLFHKRLSAHNWSAINYSLTTDTNSRVRERPISARDKSGRETPIIDIVSPRSDIIVATKERVIDASLIRSKLETFNLDDIVDQLRQALQEDVKTLEEHVKYLHERLDEEADFRAKTRGLFREPTLGELKEERNRLEKEVLGSSTSGGINTSIDQHTLLNRQDSLNDNSRRSSTSSTALSSPRSSLDSTMNIRPSAQPLRATHSLLSTTSSSNNNDLTPIAREPVQHRKPRLSIDKKPASSVNEQPLATSSRPLTTANAHVLVKLGSIKHYDLVKKYSTLSKNSSAVEQPMLNEIEKTRLNGAERFRRMVLECRDND
ncbi:unnamed protein product [Didymodactylos carnosus]|uniref:Hexosyltransferase n=1 Tax=Didymodactylos carnosus TaxID=1234261 RepID=A0A813UDZ8_9BILA|nr:unnamed protein product [Didymodactylos carnosus]CAF3608608.1 unnamed protein product [Didymodactylos carnosus]